MAPLLDIDLLDDDDPFEIDRQAAHLFKHPNLGIDDVNDVWRSDPLFYPAKPPAHWLMVAEIAGRAGRAAGATELRRCQQVPPDRLLCRR